MSHYKWPVPAGILYEGLLSSKVISTSVLSVIWTVILPLPDVASVTIVTFKNSGGGDSSEISDTFFLR